MHRLEAPDVTTNWLYVCYDANKQHPIILLAACIGGSNAVYRIICLVELVQHYSGVWKVKKNELPARLYGFPQCVNEPFWLYDNTAKCQDIGYPILTVKNVRTSVTRPFDYVNVS